MNYFELVVTIEKAEEYQKDMLINELAAIGFDTFEETEHGFRAYIPAAGFNEQDLSNCFEVYRGRFIFSHEMNEIEQQNWNQVWESNFEPIGIRDQVFVRATFHQPRPEIPIEIVIDPKMAFGTGHHETTSMMMELMLDAGVAGKKVLDMGCGTGILAILAEKLGAIDIAAVDLDLACYDSTSENAQLNNCHHIRVYCGSQEAIPHEKFDFIFANINRNILLDQMDRYAWVLQSGGELYLSGFYENHDLEIVKREAAKYDLRYLGHLKAKDWVAARLKK